MSGSNKQSERVSIVTGAGSGIGRSVAKALADNGDTVVLAGRRETTLRETESLLETADGTAVVCPTDVTQAESVRALFQTTEERFGRLDLLFNNAGLGTPPVPLDELDVALWEQVVATNLTGVFLCTQQAFRLMKSQSPQGGRIINNGSISAESPRPHSIAYTATKHAVTGLTKSTSLDGRRYDIACGQIDIGNAATAMTEKMKEGVPQANGENAVEPTMNVDDVARAVVYMASLPHSANVQFMTVMATKMPFIGRG